MKILLSLILLATSSLFAWDGQRKGFLLGIGAGAASAGYGLDDAEDDLDPKTVQWLSAMTASRIGYAWTNSSAIELYSNSVGVPGAGYVGYSAINYQWWNSPEVNANSWFGGVGLLSESNGISYKDFDPKPADMGFGLNIGYGREIASHASVELNMIMGAMTDEHYRVSNDEWEKGKESSNVFVALSVSMNLTGY
ncbi:MAG: hypothetical protein IPN71_13145 [Fibrobacteres bacterium]|nr:hypothetical protein [Fibrobacterota bacterium]